MARPACEVATTVTPEARREHEPSSVAQLVRPAKVRVRRWTTGAGRDDCPVKRLSRGKAQDTKLRSQQSAMIGGRTLSPLITATETTSSR